MIKILKWIWKKMIEIGNQIISSISVGSSVPQRIDVQDTQVWPTGQTQYYIVLTPTQATGLTEQSQDVVVHVSANTPSWGVYDYQNIDWVDVSANGNTAATISVHANSSSGRNGNVVFSGGGIEQTFYVQQVGGYYMRLLSPSNPATAATAGGNISISFISTYRDNPYTAITSSVTYNTGSGWATFVNRSQNGNIITYTYHLEANTDTAQNRITTFRFEQDAIQSTQYLVVSFTQAKAYTPANISGFTRFTTGTHNYDRDWQIGKYQAGTSPGPNGTIQPTYAIALLNVNPVTATCEANFDLSFYYGMIGSSSYPIYDTASGPRTINIGDTVQIPNGDLAYGIVLVSPRPNSNITNVSGLTVTQV